MASVRPAGRASYRNLRVWIESFDLALDLFQMTWRLEGADGRALSRRLIESSSRMPVAVARGQSSGSASEFVRCLNEGLAELTDLETHLLMCGQLGFLTPEQIKRYEMRVMKIRRMTVGLIRRLKHGSGAASESREAHEDRGSVDGDGSAERGAALVIAILVSAALSVIGTVFLQIASTEVRIASQRRDDAQLLNVAETGARAVKHLFDQPSSGDPSSTAMLRHAFLGRLEPRDPGAFDRSLRQIDDGDPSTPTVAADGTPGREWYRQGRAVSPGASHLDLFQKPYRQGTVLSFVGTEDGPDIALIDRSGLVDLLDEINETLFVDQERAGRIERIDIYAPPVAQVGSTAARLGIATVKVTAAKYRRLDRSGPVPFVPAGAQPIARAVVRMVLAEIPTNAPRGPLEACGDIVAPGPMRARWGRVQAVGDITLADRFDTLDSTVSSSFPYASFDRRISGTSSGGDLADWLNDPDESVEDPWLKVVAGGELIGWQAYPDQPLPYRQSIRIDNDHSNLFQRVAGMTCPSFEYDVWKGIVLAALPGERHVHYFSFDPATQLFREGGTGPARSVRDWTHLRSGLFFFDTADGMRPGTANLTPPVLISGGDWSTAGLIYLNASSFEATTARGVDRVLVPPGEPFDDVDHDLVPSPVETFVNLEYATAVGSGGPQHDMLKRGLASQSAVAQSPDGETYSISTTLQRDPKGPPLLAAVNLFGVLYNSGDIVAEGGAVTYGSLQAGRSVTQTNPGAPTPWVFFDERLNTGEWPPPEIAMPRTFVLAWQTSHP